MPHATQKNNQTTHTRQSLSLALATLSHKLKVIYNANGYTPLYKGKMLKGEVQQFSTLGYKRR